MLASRFADGAVDHTEHATIQLAVVCIEKCARKFALYGLDQSAPSPHRALHFQTKA
jgi:hypothetical protein